MTLLQRWKQTALHNKALVLTGVIVALGTVFGTGAAIFQVCLANQTNKQTSAQIGRLIDAANTQASASQRNAEAAEGFATTSKAAVEEFKKAAAQSVAASAKEAANAERAIVEATNNSKVALRVSQRPYLTVENVRFDPPIDPTNNPSFIKFDLHNSGRTPAINVIKAVTVYIDGIEIKSVSENVTDEVTVATDRSVTPSEKLSMDPFLRLRVTNATATLVLKGTLSYSDVFKDEHTGRFCAQWDKDSAAWKYCPGNDVN